VAHLIGDVGEDDSLGDGGAGPLERRFLETNLSRCGETKEPQDRVGVLLENIEPDAKDERIDLDVKNGRKQIQQGVRRVNERNNTPCRAGSSWQR
jgi:hypothetical protein